MKKHISLNQLLELKNLEAVQKNHKFDYCDLYFLKGVDGDFVEDPEPVYDDGEYSCPDLEYNEMGYYRGKSGDMYPCYTIGDMIDLIKEHIWEICPEEDPKGWVVHLSHGGDYNLGKEFHSFELCDALWEAVKFVLGAAYD